MGNGVKYKAWYGGSGAPAIIKEIEGYLGRPLPRSERPAEIVEVDFNTPYIDAISKFADLEVIKASGLKFAVDCMYGAGRGGAGRHLYKAGSGTLSRFRAAHDPLFPGINPEPIEPHIRMLQDVTVAEKCHAGLATDGDADRIGAVR